MCNILNMSLNNPEMSMQLILTFKLNLYLPLLIPFQMLFVKKMAFFPFRSTLKSLGVILGGGLNIKVL